MLYFWKPLIFFLREKHAQSQIDTHNIFGFPLPFYIIHLKMFTMRKISRISTNITALPCQQLSDNGYSANIKNWLTFPSLHFPLSISLPSFPSLHFPLSISLSTFSLSPFPSLHFPPFISLPSFPSLHFPAFILLTPFSSVFLDYSLFSYIYKQHFTLKKNVMKI